MAKIGVIGSGTWGTAIAVLLNNNGHQVDLWSAIPAEIEEMKNTLKHKNLPEVTLPENICYTTDLKTAMEEKDLLVLSVPSVFVRSTARRMNEFCRDGQIIVDVAKGIEEETLMTMTQIIKDEIPQCEPVALSGPSHAEEVSRGLLTTCVAGSHKREVAEYVQSLFMSPAFRVYTSPDVLGIEVGAALKNVIALAAGIADGYGLGDNNIDLAQLAHANHALKLGSVLRFGTADAFICENLNQFPFCFFFDFLGVDFNLSCVRILLVCRIGRDTAVRRDSLLLDALL